MVINRPPLGWNTWNTFGPDINEALIMESADAMVNTGLKDAGYEYIVIDDIWSLKTRDESGRLVPDPEKFPHGMKYVADYVHSKGLKFGMYSCAGLLTCAGYPGSFEHEWVDAQTFAEWGVDFLKYDFCFHPTAVRADIQYKRMALALANCGRDILFSACSWGAENTRQWIKETGAHMWRSTGDIMDNWQSIKTIGQSQLMVQEYNGRGCFNDMDMLVVGMNGKGNAALGGCTSQEYQLHFSLWALLNSPLMIGCDIRNMSDDTRRILMNKDVLAINQDPAGCIPFFANANMEQMPNDARKAHEPFYQKYSTDCPVVVKYLENGDVAIGIFNFMDEVCSSHVTTILTEMIGLPASSGKTIQLTDVWSGEVLQAVDGVLYMSDGVAPHSCRLFRAKVVNA